MLVLRMDTSWDPGSAELGSRAHRTAAVLERTSVPPAGVGFAIVNLKLLLV